MGVNARILFRVNGRTLPIINVPDAVLKIDKVDDDESVHATHEIDSRWRFYGPGYERGPWPEIAAMLIELMSMPEIDSVWYFGDCTEYDEQFTVERLEQYTRHYIKNGNRSYDLKFQ